MFKYFGKVKQSKQVKVKSDTQWTNVHITLVFPSWSILQFIFFLVLTCELEFIPSDWAKGRVHPAWIPHRRISSNNHSVTFTLVVNLQCSVKRRLTWKHCVHILISNQIFWFVCFCVRSIGDVAARAVVGMFFSLHPTFQVHVNKALKHFGLVTSWAILSFHLSLP